MYYISDSHFPPKFKSGLSDFWQKMDRYTVHEMVFKGFHTYFLQRKLQEIEIKLAFFEGQSKKMLPNGLDWHRYLAGKLKRFCFLHTYSWISCINLV